MPRIAGPRTKISGEDDAGETFSTVSVTERNVLLLIISLTSQHGMNQNPSRQHQKIPLCPWAKPIGRSIPETIADGIDLVKP
jgi:hypothetical protein